MTFTVHQEALSLVKLHVWWVPPSSSGGPVKLVSSHLDVVPQASEIIGYLATVVDSWVYIDGGEFSFLNNGSSTYQYCTITCPI